MSHEFLDSLRRELINSGEVSKDFMDYIDSRIEDAISNRVGDIIANNEERLIEDLTSKFVTKAQIR